MATFPEKQTKHIDDDPDQNENRYSHFDHPDMVPDRQLTSDA
jgi:hypothetical protein